MPYNQPQFHTNFEPQTPPVDYSTGSFTTINAEAPLSPPSMPPPRDALDAKHKRQKHSQSVGSPATSISDVQSPYTGPLDPYSHYMAMPLTPNSSVSSSDTTTWSTSSHHSPAILPPDLRRMSVHSIINNDFSEHSEGNGHGKQYPIADFSATTYGYDMGLPDLDTPNNNDFAAIAIFSPQADTMELGEETPYGSADTRSHDMAFESGGYYATPVPIRISKSLGTLPPILLENPMNLLYFHHFLNHTARILVPHDCERNPFRQILPESNYYDPVDTRPH
jgi:hypothetical protein